MTKPPKQPDSSHSILEDIMASMPVRIFWKDRDSRFLGCNELFAKDAGFDDPAEMIGKTDSDMPWKSQANRYRTDDLAVMESGMPKLGYEQQMTTAGDRKIWLHISKAPLFDEHDEVIGVLGIAEDITVQKSAEEMRQASEARFHALFDQSPLAVQMVTTDGRTVRVNRAWETLWGVPFEALKDYNLFEDRYLLESDLMPLIKKALDGETVMMPEVEYDKAATPEVFDQEVSKIWVHTQIFPLMQADGSVQEIVLVHEDVTGRKRMEQELAEKREQHELAQEIAHLGHWTLDLVENNLIWSDEVYRIFGLDSGTVATYEAFLSRIHPEDAEFVNSAYTESVEKRSPYNIEHRLLMPDGSVKWVQERCKTWYGKDGTPLRSIGTVLDISKRKQAELALHETMEKFQSLVESSSDWIWEVDAEGIYTYASPKVAEMLGYEPAEVLGKTPFDFMPADEKERVGELFAEIIREQRPFSDLENRNVHKDGHIVVLETSGVPVFDKRGELCGYHGIDRDISERKRTEHQLRQFRHLVDESSDAVFVIDPATAGFVDVNDRACANLGYSRDELLRLDVMGIQAAFPSRFSWEKHAAGLKAAGSMMMEGMHRRKDGSAFPVEVSIRYVPGQEEGDRIIAIARDVSERRRMEQKLAEKRELHEMAQQIAHLGHWTRDLVENSLVWSDEIYRIFGVEPDKADAHETLLRMIHPDDADDVSRAYTGHVENRVPYDIEHRLLMPDGSVKWVKDRCETWYAEDGTPLRSIGTTQDITDSKILEETLYLTAHREWDTNREGYFQALATHLARSLRIDYVLINVLADEQRARSVAFYCKGKIVENAEYSLRDTPCENVVGHQLCYYPEDIQRLFPRDEMLVEMGAESYLGIPLWNGRGEPLGLIPKSDKGVERRPFSVLNGSRSSVFLLS